MNYAIQIPYDCIEKDNIKLIPIDHEVVEYAELKEMLSDLPHPIPWFEIVIVDVNGLLVMMHVDEEGKMRPGWQERANPIATMWYGNPNDCIVGDVLLLSYHHDEETYSLNETEARLILSALGLHFPE